MQLPRKGTIPLMRGVEDLYFFFQLWFQIATQLHVKLARQRSSPLIMTFSIKLSNINSTPYNIAQAKKQSPNLGYGGGRHQGNAEQVLFQRVRSQCQHGHLKNVQLLRSHRNRVKENDKEANKRRLEAMKQLNQRWHIFRCYFSLLCGWWSIAEL